MATSRFFYLSLRHFKRSTLAFGKSFVNPKYEYPTIFLHQQIQCQITWKPTAIRAYVTERLNCGPVATKTDSKLVDFVRRVLNNYNHTWKARRSLHRDSPHLRPGWPKPETPEKMKTFIRTSVAAMHYIPGRLLGTSVLVSGAALRAFYNWHLVELPLNGRKAFHILTDEEAIRRSDHNAQQTKNRAIVVTEVDGSGQPTDPATQRVEMVMQRLIDANPELTNHLTPGARWRALAVERPEGMRYTAARSFQNGCILFNDLMVGSMTLDDLALVIAHEMAHVVQRHESEIMSFKYFFYVYLYNVMKPIMEYMPNFQLGSFISDLEKNWKFEDSEIMEREADEFGFKFASKACFDYRKFPGTMERVNNIVREAFRQSSRNPVPEPRGDETPQEDDPWGENLVNELRETRFWANIQHPDSTERGHMWALRKSKAEEWRQEKGCPPLSSR